MHSKEASEEVIKEITLDPDTGSITSDSLLVYKNVHGYIKVRKESSDFAAHRLMYLSVTGELPEEIDHINGNKSDNRIINLRPVNRTENMRNKPVYRNNTSGVKGVTYEPEKGLWRARISWNGKRLSFRSKCKELAVFVRKEMEIKYYGEHNMETPS